MEWLTGFWDWGHPTECKEKKLPGLARNLNFSCEDLRTMKLTLREKTNPQTIKPPSLLEDICETRKQLRSVSATAKQSHKKTTYLPKHPVLRELLQKCHRD